MSKKTKYPRHKEKRQKAAIEAQDESSQAQSQWQAEQLQFFTRRARACANDDEGHTLVLEAWAKRYSVPKAPFTIIRILRQKRSSPQT